MKTDAQPSQANNFGVSQRNFDSALITRNIRELQKAAKRRLLEMHYKSGVGHIGGNLSCLDILLNIFHEHKKPHEHLVLSKGHGAGALYVALWTMGVLDEQSLNSFHKNGTKLSGHPPPNAFEDIPFATGSLGHGLSLAAGMAKGNLLLGKSDRIFCVTSDGEWNEGSTWEALIFSCHQNLINLTVVIDYNRLQGFGSTDDIASLSPFSDKFKSFGITPIEIDGHSWPQLSAAIKKPVLKSPKIILANTVKGNGVSFMENKMEWHYLPMTDEQYQAAVQELEKPYA